MARSTSVTADAELAPVHDLLGQPVGRHAEPVGLLHEVGVQLLLLHAQLFGAGELVEHESGLDGAAGVRGDLGVQVAPRSGSRDAR